MTPDGRKNVYEGGLLAQYLAGSRFERPAVVRVCREHQYRRAGDGLAQRTYQLTPVTIGQPEVHHRHIKALPV